MNGGMPGGEIIHMHHMETVNRAVSVGTDSEPRNSEASFWMVEGIKCKNKPNNVNPVSIGDMMAPSTSLDPMQLMNSNAASKDGARKNIQAKFTNVNVNIHLPSTIAK